MTSPHGDGGIKLREGVKLSKTEQDECVTKLREAPMFSHLEEKHLQGLAKIMRKSQVRAVLCAKPEEYRR